MNEQTTEKRTYNNAPLADGEYYAKPYPLRMNNGKSYGVCMKEDTRNIFLAVGWIVCDKDGHPGNFDMQTGEEIPLPEGYDGWEHPKEIYTFIFGSELQNITKCAGKQVDYLKDVCPNTYKSIKRITEWCPQWTDWCNWFWFIDNKDVFEQTVARITVFHEEYNGIVRPRVKWTNPKERPAMTAETSSAISDARNKIASIYGKFFTTAESAPQPRKAAATATAAQPPFAPMPQKTKADCWAAYCRYHDSKDKELWFSLIKGFGKKEAEFTPADWAKMENDIIETPPF